MFYTSDSGGHAVDMRAETSLTVLGEAHSVHASMQAVQEVLGGECSACAGSVVMPHFDPDGVGRAVRGSSVAYLSSTAGVHTASGTAWGCWC